MVTCPSVQSCQLAAGYALDVERIVLECPSLGDSSDRIGIRKIDEPHRSSTAIPARPRPPSSCTSTRPLQGCPQVTVCLTPQGPSTGRWEGRHRGSALPVLDWPGPPLSLIRPPAAPLSQQRNHRTLSPRPGCTQKTRQRDERRVLTLGRALVACGHGAKGLHRVRPFRGDDETSEGSGSDDYGRTGELSSCHDGWLGVCVWCLVSGVNSSMQRRGRRGQEVESWVTVRRG